MLSLPTHFRCCDCKRNFKTDYGLSVHLLNSEVHRREREPQKKKEQPPKLPIGCNMCKRTFQTITSLKQHQESLRHHPICHIKCLASGKCKKRFNCPSAQLHHLESGACPSKISKAQLNAAITKNDVDGIITTQASSRWLLEEDVSETWTSPGSSPLLTPTSTEFLDSYPSTAIHTPIKSPHSSMIFGANLSQTFDSHFGVSAGHKRCPICPARRTRTFAPSALQQHLLSSVHAKTDLTLVHRSNDEISFHCPLALIKGSSLNKPLKHFSTVSGLAQHIESGACQGGKETLRRAVEYIQNEMKSVNLGGLKLLN